MNSIQSLSWINLSLFLSILSINSFVKAEEKINTTTLSIISLSEDLKCKRTFFKGTSENSNVIYYVPSIQRGTGPSEVAGVESTRILDIIKLPNEIYGITLYVHFPDSDKSLNLKADTIHTNDSGNCSDSNVLTYANKSIGEEGADKYKTVSQLPLMNILMVIDLGYKVLTASALGNSNDINLSTNILNYTGQPIPITFYVNQDDYLAITDQLLKSDTNGLKVTTFLLHNGSSKGNSITINFEQENIMNSIRSQISAQKAYAEGEISALLSKSFNSLNLKIEEESNGTNQNFELIKSKIIDSALSAIKASALTQTTETSKKDTKTDKIVSGEIILNSIQNFINNGYSYTQYNSPTVASHSEFLFYYTHRILNTEATEVTVKENAFGRTPPIYLKTGQTIKIIPLYKIQNKIEYHKEGHYMSKEELAKADLIKVFPDLNANDSVIVEDVEANFSKHAVGKINPIKLLNFLGFDFNIYEYKWFRYKRDKRVERNSSYNYTNSLEKYRFEDVEVSFSFDNINHTRKFTPAEILNEKEKWKATFDSETGVLHFKALEDLGFLMLYPRFSPLNSNKTLPLIDPTVDMLESNTARSISDSSTPSLNETSNPPFKFNAKINLRRKPKISNEVYTRLKYLNERVHCIFDKPYTREELSRCENLPEIVYDEIIQVRINTVTKKMEPVLYYFLNYDNKPQRSQQSATIKITKPIFENEESEE